MPTFSDYEIEQIMDDLDEYATLLRSFSQRLEAGNPDAIRDAPRSVVAIAHELWEIRKTLGDMRRE